MGLLRLSKFQLRGCMHVATNALHQHGSWGVVRSPCSTCSAHLAPWGCWACFQCCAVAGQWAMRRARGHGVLPGHGEGSGCQQPHGQGTRCPPVPWRLWGAGCWLPGACSSSGPACMTTTCIHTQASHPWLSCGPYQQGQLRSITVLADFVCVLLSISVCTVFLLQGADTTSNMLRR